MQALKQDVAFEANRNHMQHYEVAQKVIALFRENSFSFADAQMTLCKVDQIITEASQRARV